MVIVVLVATFVFEGCGMINDAIDKASENPCAEFGCSCPTLLGVDMESALDRAGCYLLKDVDPDNLKSQGQWLECQKKAQEFRALEMTREEFLSSEWRNPVQKALKGRGAMNCVGPDFTIIEVDGDGDIEMGEEEVEEVEQVEEESYASSCPEGIAHKSDDSKVVFLLESSPEARVVGMGVDLYLTPKYNPGYPNDAWFAKISRTEGYKELDWETNLTGQIRGEILDGFCNSRVFKTEDNKIWSIAGNGNTEMIIKDFGEISFPTVSASRRSVYFSGRKSLYKFDYKGELEWKVEVDQMIDIDSPPVLLGENFCVGGEKISCFNQETGEEVFSFQEGKASFYQGLTKMNSDKIVFRDGDYIKIFSVQDQEVVDYVYAENFFGEFSKVSGKDEVCFSHLETNPNQEGSMYFFQCIKYTEEEGVERTFKDFSQENFPLINPIFGEDDRIYFLQDKTVVYYGFDMDNVKGPRTLVCAEEEFVSLTKAHSPLIKHEVFFASTKSGKIYKIVVDLPEAEDDDSIL